ncbi:MAG: hypothetical protein CFE43_10835 [Burkholderiales bacterium PBB3]|nr:MAG: hypothetical protein CFE43_10835 [Burkholderiales bacterium PBB3]
MNTLNLLVRKDALGTTQIQTAPTLPLPTGQVRVRIERFALTSNNITYAAMGDAMQYWRFFPTQDAAWGRIPVWGFGSVQESNHPLLEVGEKLYGYFPMANTVDLTPGTISPAYFFDIAPHRAELHPVYNQYMRTSVDPFYTADTEDLQALLRPLFITSWLIDDFLADNAFFGATAVPGQRAQLLLSSASSKTAYGTAFQLAQREGVDVVGLTSPGNVAFCESLGCYSRVLTYDQLDQIAPDAPCVYVDFAGNTTLRKAIHTHCQQLKFSSSIGATHVSEMGGAKDLPGPKATLFFAPAQIKKRSAEWGSQGLGQRMVQGWRKFAAHVAQPGSAWLVVAQHQGPEAVQAAYQQVLAGKGDPRVGHMLSL